MTTDYIEYMMDRTISTYNDVKIMGIECLRNMYAASGLSIRPKTKISKNEQLTKEALSSPHRTLVDPWDNEIKVLNQVLKQVIIKELQQTQTGIFESG